MMNTPRAVSSSRASRRPRGLSRKELALLVDATYSSESLRDLREIIGLICNGGILPGELARLAWRDIDFSRGLFTVGGTKSSAVRAVPLGSTFTLIVRKRRSRIQGTPFVLGPDPRALLRRSVKELKLLSQRVVGRELQLRNFVVFFRQCWIDAGGSPATLALVTGRGGKADGKQLLAEQSLRLAAEIMQRIQH